MVKRLFIILSAFVLVPAALSAQTANRKPFVIPELKEWRGGEGEWRLSPESRIVCATDENEIHTVASMLRDDIFKLFGSEVPVANEGTALRDGDIVLTIKPDKALGDEGYSLTAAGHVTLTAPTATGLYWATRTLLQMAESHSADTGSRMLTVPQGSARDWPDYALRGFMIDCGRKFIPMEFLQDWVDIMSYYKMNFLQIHLNDNGYVRFFNNDWDKTYAAFRLESERFPGLAAEDGHYSKAEFRDLQRRAAVRCVEVMPEIDMPAHSLAFVHYKPEIGSSRYGRDHLDLFKPETYEFLDALFAEYLEGDDPVFVGPRVSIGTDEYSNKDRNVVEKFRALTDRYIRYVESFGKQACIWGSLTHAQGQTPVKSENVIMQAWSVDYAQPKAMAALGYRLISIPDRLVYIVPAAGYYHDYLDIAQLYATWTPANVNGVIFPERDPAIMGGMFAVWNDHVGNGISARDIHHRAYPAMQTLAAKCWSGKSVTVPFAEFDSRRRMLSEAPAVNLLGRHVTDDGGSGGGFRTFWQADTIEPQSEYPFEDAGYDYRIEFDIECAGEAPGTELFRSRDAVFYLSDPVSGMLGFARDGYLNRFNRRLHAGERVHIAIEGDNRSVRLYIDGRQADCLTQSTKWYSERSKTAYVPTLVFPLRRTGRFASRITDFKAKQK